MIRFKPLGTKAKANKAHASLNWTSSILCIFDTVEDSNNIQLKIVLTDHIWNVMGGIKTVLGKLWECF